MSVQGIVAPSPFVMLNAVKHLCELHTMQRSFANDQKDKGEKGQLALSFTCNVPMSLGKCKHCLPQLPTRRWPHFGDPFVEISLDAYI